LFLATKLYEFVYLPWKVRQKYKKYPNVGMAEKYHPMLGDIVIINKNEQENKFKMQHYIDDVKSKPDTDIYISQFGPVTLYEICSPKAFDEFERLVPEKIDRNDQEGTPIGYIAPRSFGVIESTANWNERRKFILKAIGINYASKYIPLMIETVDKWAKSVKKHESIDLNFEMNRITFGIITRILFGRDIENMET